MTTNFALPARSTSLVSFASRNGRMTSLLLVGLLAACDSTVTESHTDGHDTHASHASALAPQAAPQLGTSAAGSTTEKWDSVLKDVTLKGDVVVPANERWLIGPNVQIAGNLRTEGGTIAMRPGSSLKFLGGDPDKYVGGGMGYEAKFANDIGLWVGSNGVLDIRGTPKTGWNRTGKDATWKSTDEYWIAPTGVDDFVPKRWYPGQPIPQINPLVPAAEVMNVTRDVVIEGPGHIHIHSTKPQRVEYVTLRGMGVSNKKHEGSVLGRYALHIHHSGDGSRGTIIRGVAAVNSKGTVFVPHESNGITFTDVVSVNSYGSAFWWDNVDRSNDLIVDRFAASGVYMPRSVTGKTSHETAVSLGGGTNLVIRNSAASGARGSSISHGFDWPSSGDNEGSAIWDFKEGNVAHNNEGSGVRLWFNSFDDHVIANVITYRHGMAGIENGAYANATLYTNTVSVDDKVVQHASGRATPKGRPARFERITAIARKGPALAIGRLRAAPSTRTEFIDCTLEAGPGSPKVQLANPETAQPFIALFRHCGVTPDDIDIVAPYSKALAKTSIVIEHESGKKWELTLDMVKNRKVVREIK
jgi:hypothetical protein